MTSFADVVVAVLLLVSGIAVVVAALGLVRLPDFFVRMHAPALAYTLGSWSVAVATIVHFSAHEGVLSLHAWLIAILLAITAPVTTVLLARAAVFRHRQAKEEVPPPLTGAGG
ncbi:Na+/H+ antiporter subunit G [Caldimonas brevitalea]|uniref:Cation:proton antiporter n=1 Tax=Caldimonas brevitalea TaxID=413882 RepID=A0A0G3BKZ1_9BURK|nr:Na+/H+ antiporter subunit G [Caldimonas brevitalea]AKJ30067.1 cation:proton antiporter [Caldimonas brevitalea]